MNIPDITEARAIKLFTKEFGDDFDTRYEKFQEEVNELHEEITEYTYDKSPERLLHIKDELSDVQGTFTHLASIMGLYQSEMLHNCIDKVEGRKIDPNYKRFNVANNYLVGLEKVIIKNPKFRISPIKEDPYKFKMIGNTKVDLYPLGTQIEDKYPFTIKRQNYPVEITFGINHSLIPDEHVPFYDKLEIEDQIQNTFGDVLIRKEEGYVIFSNDYEKYLSVDAMYNTKWKKI